jgi:hypothetical protein
MYMVEIIAAHAHGFANGVTLGIHCLERLTLHIEVLISIDHDMYDFILIV